MNEEQWGAVGAMIKTCFRQSRNLDMACFRNVGDDNDVSVRVAIWFCRAEAPQEGDSLVFVVGVRRGTSHFVYPFHEHLLVAPAVVSPGI